MIPVTIEAKDIRLGDILGEGMVVWMTVAGDNFILVYWGTPPETSLINSKKDSDHILTFDKTDKVKVLRKEDDEQTCKMGETTEIHQGLSYSKGRSRSTPKSWTSDEIHHDK